MMVKQESTNLELKKQIKQCQIRYDKLLASSLQERKRTELFAKKILFQQEQERKEISRELHDEIAQLLTGVNFYLGALSKEAHGAERTLHSKIATTQQLIIDCVDAVYLFAKELRPLSLDDLGLVAALKSYVKDFIVHTNIPVRMNMPTTRLCLSDFNKTTLFRVAQECLTNVRKHAKASHVTLTLKKINGQICLTIKDNGKSFVVSREAKKRMGITGIHERVKLAQGTVEIVSRPNHGTRVKVCIPITNGV